MPQSPVLNLKLLSALNRKQRNMKPGVFIRKKETEFVVHSRANRMELLLFDEPKDDKPIRKIEMTRGRDALWHTVISDAGPGTLYLYCTDSTPEQWLLDPLARAVHSPRVWGDSSGFHSGQPIRTGMFIPKGVVVQDAFDWTGEIRPHTPLEKTILYEVHLRGFTRREANGTYLDFIQKIPYLKSLGITAVEFLPLFEFNELELFLEGAERQSLLNFWGYSPLAFFAPMSRYAAHREPGAAVHEFKTLVKALHIAGIEIILDVVFNHTAEGPIDGPIYNFRGFDEAAYYLLDANGAYQNWSGCGNSLNANHPITRQFLIECLKYWAKEMHIDGFRFDLATTLCRSEDGKLLSDPPLIKAIETEPDLQNIKFTAEAWDAGGGYQIGCFPGKCFSEWNGRFRDDLRRFWNCNTSVGSLATRLAGSSDLYQHNGGSPLKSINYVTAHDGFTLADLVCYKHKHNEANKEKNRDGEKQNDSINFGIEGPSINPPCCARRLKQQKNLLACLFLARGVPMLTAGDEFGRTQRGNNNAYCQDNEISWVDWSFLEKNRELFKFTQSLIALRREYPALCSGIFFRGKDDVQWFAQKNREIDWYNDRSIGMHIRGENDLIILINDEKVNCSFELPEGRWDIAFSTAPHQPVQQKNSISIQAHSMSGLTQSPSGLSF